jgi:hypothetical protein
MLFETGQWFLENQSPVRSESVMKTMTIWVASSNLIKTTNQKRRDTMTPTWIEYVPFLLTCNSDHLFLRLSRPFGWRSPSRFFLLTRPSIYRMGSLVTVELLISLNHQEEAFHLDLSASHSRPLYPSTLEKLTMICPTESHPLLKYSIRSFERQYCIYTLSQVTINAYWNLMEPWLRPIREEDISFLEYNVGVILSDFLFVSADGP